MNAYPETDAIRSKLFDIGCQYGCAMLIDVAKLGDRGGPKDWDRMLAQTRSDIRKFVDDIVAAHRNANAMDAAGMMVEAIEDGLFNFLESMTLSGSDVEGHA